MVTLDDCAMCVSLGQIQESDIIQTVDYLPRCWKHGGNVSHSQVRSIDNLIGFLSKNTALVNEYRKLHGAKPLCVSRQDFWHDFDNGNECKWCGYNTELCAECQENPKNKKYWHSLCADCDKKWKIKYGEEE